MMIRWECAQPSTASEVQLWTHTGLRQRSSVFRAGTVLDRPHGGTL